MSDRPDDATSSRSRRMATVHWSQPCTGLVKNPDNTQRDLSRHILHELSTAHSFLIDFRTKYARSAMDSTQPNVWEALEAETPQFKYDFLNAIAPENPEDFNSQLLHAYEKMQRLAVGIEQVTLDQALYEGDLLQDFRKIETHIVKILCQLHYAMVHQELKPPMNVTKEIMDESYRDLDGTSARTMRDSVIVLAYNAAVDHLKDIFVKFENQ